VRDENRVVGLPSSEKHLMSHVLKASGIAILLFALAGCAHQSDNTAAPLMSPTKHSDSALTYQEYDLARALVRSEIRRLKDVVTNATVTVVDATTIDSAIGYRCPSGRLLQIKLIGDFVHIAVSPMPIQPGAPTPDITVHAVNLTAGAKTGLTCLIGVQTGKVSPEPGAISLPLN